MPSKKIKVVEQKENQDVLAQIPKLDFGQATAADTQFEKNLMDVITQMQLTAKKMSDTRVVATRKELFTEIERMLVDKIGCTKVTQADLFSFKLPAQFFQYFQSCFASEINEMEHPRTDRLVNLLELIIKFVGKESTYFVYPYYTEIVKHLGIFQGHPDVQGLYKQIGLFVAQHNKTVCTKFSEMDTQFRQDYVFELIQGSNLDAIKAALNSESRINIACDIIQTSGNRSFVTVEKEQIVSFALRHLIDSEQYETFIKLMDFINGYQAYYVLKDSFSLKNEKAVNRMRMFAMQASKAEKATSFFTKIAQTSGCSVTDPAQFLIDYDPDLEVSLVKSKFYVKSRPVHAWVPKYFNNIAYEFIEKWKKGDVKTFNGLDAALRSKIADSLGCAKSDFSVANPGWYNASKTCLYTRTYVDSFKEVYTETAVLTNYLKHVKAIENAQPEQYSKFAVIYGYLIYIEQVLSGRLKSIMDVPKLVMNCLQQANVLAVNVKGWYDFIREYNNSDKLIQVPCVKTAWAVVRQYAKIDPNAEEFLKKSIQCNLDADLFGGTFSTTNYFKICQRINVADPGKSTIINKGLVKLVNWFGSDYAGLEAAVSETIGSAKKVTGVMMSSLFSQYDIKGLTLEQVAKWKPFFVKYPKLVTISKLVANIEPKASYANFSEVIDHIARHKYPALYKDGTSAINVKLVESAILDGWSYAKVSQALKLAPQAKKEQMIPQVCIENTKWNIKTLDKGDLTALYIGNVTGCCQYIGGYGANAAKQSFTEKWCDVLVIKNAADTKYLAQSFLWMNKSKSVIVLDSIEGLFRNADNLNQVSEAIIEWAAKIVEAGYKVGISTANCGITRYVLSKISEMLITHKSLKMDSSIHSYEGFERVLYKDANGVRLIESRVTRKVENEDKDAAAVKVPRKRAVRVAVAT